MFLERNTELFVFLISCIIFLIVFHFASILDLSSSIVEKSTSIAEASCRAGDAERRKGTAEMGRVVHIQGLDFPLHKRHAFAMWLIFSEKGVKLPLSRMFHGEGGRNMAMGQGKTGGRAVVFGHLCRKHGMKVCETSSGGA